MNSINGSSRLAMGRRSSDASKTRHAVLRTWRRFFGFFGFLRRWFQILQGTFYLFIIFFFWLKYLKMLTEWSSNSNTNGSFRGGREGGGVEGVFERFSMDSTAEWIEGSFPSFETLMNSFRDSRDVSNGFSSVWFCHGGDTSASFTSQWIDSEILGPLPRILVPIKTNWNELKWTNEWVREGGGLKEREEKRQETSEEG